MMYFLSCAMSMSRLRLNDLPAQYCSENSRPNSESAISLSRHDPHIEEEEVFDIPFFFASAAFCASVFATWFRVEGLGFGVQDLDWFT